MNRSGTAWRGAHCSGLVKISVYNQVKIQVGNQVDNQVWDQVFSQVGNQVWSQVRNQVLHPVWLASVKPEIERLNQHKISAT